MTVSHFKDVLHDIVFLKTTLLNSSMKGGKKIKSFSSRWWRFATASSAIEHWENVCQRTSELKNHRLKVTQWLIIFYISVHWFCSISIHKKTNKQTNTHPHTHTPHTYKHIQTNKISNNNFRMTSSLRYSRQSGEKDEKKKINKTKQNK